MRGKAPAVDSPQVLRTALEDQRQLQRCEREQGEDQDAPGFILESPQLRADVFVTSATSDLRSR